MTKTQFDTLPKLTILSEQENDGQFLKDVALGLAAKPKYLSSKYFYDEKGSRLFEEIMKLPEYYLTNCEQQIFETHKGDFLNIVKDEPFCLVDLGAGDATKTRILIDHFTANKAQFKYIPIDISKEITEELITKINTQYPQLQAEGVIGDYFEGLHWLGENIKYRKLVLFMGSNIGNFDKAGSVKFLESIWNSLDKDDLLLVGFDLKKDPHTILKAYDDSKGVTAEFNYNLLRRINRELGADFNLDKWKHYATYHPITGAVESFLISQDSQGVYISSLGQRFHFEKNEPIHTEYSCKYSVKEIESLANESHFTPVKNFYSTNGYFVDAIWRVVK